VTVRAEERQCAAAEAVGECDRRVWYAPTAGMETAERHLHTGLARWAGVVGGDRDCMSWLCTVRHMERRPRDIPTAGEALGVDAGPVHLRVVFQWRRGLARLRAVSARSWECGFAVAGSLLSELALGFAS